jgi:hypothetical protein
MQSQVQQVIQVIENEPLPITQVIKFYGNDGNNSPVMLDGVTTILFSFTATLKQGRAYRVKAGNILSFTAIPAHVGFSITFQGTVPTGWLNSALFGGYIPAGDSLLAAGNANFGIEQIYTMVTRPTQDVLFTFLGACIDADAEWFAPIMVSVEEIGNAADFPNQVEL